MSNTRPDPALPRHSRAATIADVAAAARVSVRTVSRALNKSPKVSEPTRRSIEQAITALNFRPSLHARGLAAQRSFLLGVVQGDQNAHVIGVIQQGIVEVCSKAGYELLVHPVRADDALLTTHLDDFVRRTKIDGLVLLPPVSENPAVPALLARLGVATVGIAAVPVPNYPAMLVTRERAAAGLVADHLVELGHRHIGMITGPLRLHSALEREAGFRQALGRHGIDLCPSDVREGDYSFSSGLNAAAELLSRPDRPTAIFAANDIMAAAVLKVANEQAIDVPSALSVVGFDDSDIALMLSPALTTIRRPLLQIAHEATRRLISLAEGESQRFADYQVELSMIERQSTFACAS